MANRRLRLVEVDFIFLHGTGDLRQNRITIHAGLFRSKLNLSFSIGGPAETRETLPGVLVDAIKAGLEYAGKHVRPADLVEIDPEPEDEENED